MPTKIREHVMIEISIKMGRQNHMIALICFNASCNKLDKNVANLQVFLPPNTKSLIQPLDQDIIRTTKVYYRTQPIRHMVIAIDNGVGPVAFAKSIKILKAFSCKRGIIFC